LAGHEALPAGRARILFVAGFFYTNSTLSILVFGLSLAAPHMTPPFPTLFWGLAIGVAAFYLLKGSTFAKRFLVAISVISLLTAIPLLWLADNLFTRLLGVFFGIGGACSLYLLTFSATLRHEFERRHADYEAAKRAARQKFYDEFETANDKDGG